MQKVSLCITILNEEKTLERLLIAIENQSLLPDEVIIVDGGSTDTSLSVISDWSSHHQPQFSLQILQTLGNRSVGRNTAISHARNSWIAVTDAGCVPHADWLEQLVAHQKKSGNKVIAGYYDAVVQTPLEEAMVPYVLVMPDRVNPNSFLPATRSMLFHRSIWKNAGGFDQSLSDNEDYAFARKIQSFSTISFTKAAKVSWIPRQNIRQFYTMLFRFARGDIQASIVRPKVILLFLRYIIAFMLLLFLSGSVSTASALGIFLLVGCSYSLWAVMKNKHYAPSGWYWLPLLQFTADFAVMHGSVAGLLRISL